jgi:lipoyl(octanoyl) transferase
VSTGELPSEPEPIVGRWLGRQEFASCLREQIELRDRVIAGTSPDTILLVEHPATLTLGRRGRREDVLWTDEQLASEGVDVCETPRGGEVTLHAPGQLVAYPVVRVGRKIREHIVRLAEVTIQMFSELGVDGIEFRMDHPGVWRGETKMASIGIHISRGVAVQGISMNLDVDPRLFGSLVSCGLPQVRMASVAQLEASPLPSLAALAQRWAELFAADLDRPLAWS